MDNKQYKVNVIENSAEGSQIHSVEEFDTEEEAKGFVALFNENLTNIKKMPDWYLYAQLMG